MPGNVLDEYLLSAIAPKFLFLVMALLEDSSASATSNSCSLGASEWPLWGFYERMLSRHTIRVKPKESRACFCAPWTRAILILNEENSLEWLYIAPG